MRNRAAPRRQWALGDKGGEGWVNAVTQGWLLGMGHAKTKLETKLTKPVGFFVVQFSFVFFSSSSVLSNLN